MSVVTDVPGEWLNVAMRAWVDGGGDLRQALAAVAPLIAKAERERCIAIAHKWPRDGQSPTALGIIIGIEGDET